MERQNVTVIGGGPAGSAAALAALAEGAAVTVYEKSRFPRHKVCGEFISPEVMPALEALGLMDGFLAAGPARLTEAILHFGRSRKCFRFPEAAFSLSRYALDRFLLDQAANRGAEMKIEAKSPLEAAVIAHGRQTPAPKGNRLFGYKAHFRGSIGDTVEMFFSEGCYTGLSPVECGEVNVCGLAPEEMLRAHGFRPEALLPQSLKDRLRPMEQSFEWIVTGPLVFHEKFHEDSAAYLAGDALGFVDPFTGSGILSALLTGRLAGKAAARGASIASYNAECRRILRRQYSVASMMRRALGAGLAETLARWIPGPLLYRLTRPEL